MDLYLSKEERVIVQYATIVWSSYHIYLGWDTVLSFYEKYKNRNPRNRARRPAEGANRR